MSSHAGQLLVGDALELRHRLPRTRARIHALTLSAWRGRRIAEATRSLPLAGALWVDAQVSPFAHKVGPRRLANLVAAAVVRFDPEQAAKRAKDRADGRGVWLVGRDHRRHPLDPDRGGRARRGAPTPAGARTATTSGPTSPDGPPGQTSADSLAPLCRRHHRMKTHGGWWYSMPEPGLYLWRSLTGRRYLVDHTGTQAVPASE
jgi:hypothetical protein